ncbi:MAG: zinc-binding dehydrogenase [Chloroflexi bacterium]|nr:zinc-binding dehydrogenase [Chloroflexota bacterium]
MAAGNIKPVIDRCYPFERIPKAHRCRNGHKTGNVVVNVQ